MIESIILFLFSQKELRKTRVSLMRVIKDPQVGRWVNNFKLSFHSTLQFATCPFTHSCLWFFTTFKRMQYRYYQHIQFIKEKLSQESKSGLWISNQVGLDGQGRTQLPGHYSKAQSPTDVKIYMRLSWEVELLFGVQLSGQRFKGATELRSI